MNRRRFLQIMGLAGAATAMPFGFTAPARASEGQALMLSDVHWDVYRWPEAARELVRSPWTDWHSILTRLGELDINAYGQETSYGLLESALDAMAAACPDPSVIVFPGDLPTHYLWSRFSSYSSGGTQAFEQFVTNLVAFMGSRIRARFAHRPIFFTLGNNDAFCGDYQVNPGGAYLASTADTYLNAFLNRPEDADSFLPSFQAMGCYSLPVSILSHGRIIAINTNLLSAHFSCQCCKTQFDPNVVLDWLAAELRKAERQGEWVWLLAHIPFGINAYNTARGVVDGRLGTVVDHLVPAYNARLLEILRQYAGTVTTVLNGHTHMDAFKVLCASDGHPLVPAHITPALNGLFGGNPAFKVLHMDSVGFAVRDWEVHHMDLSAPDAGWQREYRFSEAYGVEPDASGLAALHQAMADQGQPWQHYRDWYNGGQTLSPTIRDGQFQTFWLAQRWHDEDSFRAAWQDGARAYQVRAA